MASSERATFLMSALTLRVKMAAPKIKNPAEITQDRETARRQGGDHQKKAGNTTKKPRDVRGFNVRFCWTQLSSDDSG